MTFKSKMTVIQWNPMITTQIIKNTISTCTYIIPSIFFTKNNGLKCQQYTLKLVIWSIADKRLNLTFLWLTHVSKTYSKVISSLGIKSQCSIVWKFWLTPSLFSVYDLGAYYLFPKFYPSSQILINNMYSVTIIA